MARHLKKGYNKNKTLMAEKYAIINSIINISFFIRRIRPMQPEVNNKKAIVAMKHITFHKYD